jgi:YesN/AraC family two-component response regulator
MLTLMIAEDEERIRLGIETILNKYPGGIKVVGSHRNGMEAATQLASMKPGELDVLITDVEMPAMNGLQLIERAKAKMPDLFIIVLSGYDEFEYVRQAMRFGAADYLLKPMDKSEMFRLLQRHQETKEARTAGTGIAQPAPAKRFDEQVKAILGKEYNQPFDLKRVSDQVGFSPGYTSKMFKQTTGETITEYLSRLRIEKAKEFLNDHLHLKVYEIAPLVGCPDKMYFQKLFKKMTGLTPKEYRERERQ